MFTLSPDQDEALTDIHDFLMSSSQEYILTGSPGMGKSFLTNQIVQSAESNGFGIIMAAMTHKAAAVVMGFTGRDAFTAHKVFNLRVKKDYAKNETITYYAKPKKGPFLETHTEDRIWSQNTLLCLDEASMMDENVKEFVNKALSKYRKLKILYIGDRNQLPPIEDEQSIVFNSGINTSVLTTHHRQGEESSIIPLSIALKESIEKEDWFVTEVMSSKNITVLSEEDFVDTLVKYYTSDEYVEDVNYVKALAYRNSTVNDMNAFIRKQFYTDPEYQIDERLVVNTALVRGGIVLAATESMVTVVSNVAHELKGVKGRLLTLINEEGSKFEAVTTVHKRKRTIEKNKLVDQQKWREVYAFMESFIDVRPIFASTVHKSQGSTYENVFIHLEDVCECSNFKDIARLVYVGLTRAKNHVYVYGAVPEVLQRSK